VRVAAHGVQDGPLAVELERRRYAAIVAVQPGSNVHGRLSKE
jgi:hypothetical protein